MVPHPSGAVLAGPTQADGFLPVLTMELGEEPVGALTELQAQADDGQRDPSPHQQHQEAVSTQHLVR